MDTQFQTPMGTFELSRPGATDKSPLRAWDGADGLVLTALPAAMSSVLVFNDGFGALATSLSHVPTTSVSDSLVALQTAEENLAVNGIENVELNSSLDPLAPAGVIIVKIPRTLSLLEHQLHQIRSIARPDTTIIGAGMVKHIHNSTLALFETIIGPTTTSLASKKARLIHPTLDSDLTPPANPWPQTVKLDSGHEVVVNAGVFAGTKLDVGARALLANLPEIEGPADVLDLGCGNGVIGVAAAAKNPSASVTFVDESFLALQSARSTMTLNHPDRTAAFLIDDGGEGLDARSFDLVLNNPPFHENNVLNDATAWRMFKQSKRILRPGGELRVVGNRHLGYHTKLHRIFGNCEVVASTSKFVVLSARQEKGTNVALKDEV